MKEVATKNERKKENDLKLKIDTAFVDSCGFFLLFVLIGNRCRC